MTRVFLAAGVAALAIAAPAAAGPHGQHGGGGGGGGGGRPAFVNRGGGGGGHGGGGFAAPRMQRQAAPRMQRSFAAPRMAHQQRFARMERPQRAPHVQMHAQRQPMRMSHAQTRMAARQQMRGSHSHAQRMASHQQMRSSKAQAMNRHQMRANRVQQAQSMRGARMHANNRTAMRQQVQANRGNRASNRMAMRQQLQANRGNLNNRMAMRKQLQANRLNGAPNRMAMRQQFRAGGARTLLAERHALRPDRIANVGAFQQSRLANMAITPRTQFIAPAEAVRFVDQPVRVVNNYVPLEALPASYSYLYPATADYYYQYGGGYLYQVDRSSSLIDALIPLLAGGFLPGTYLPAAYMSSYVPAYYGLNSFYPASFDYGYGYGMVCNRYAYGVVYQVDCGTGMVENVIPMYAGGYGVGQVLPSAYAYYNLPMQYRSYYYPTADYSYWYAPGAIYQYDPRTSLITSVAALMTPGFSVGQPLPIGYDMYNVPMAYRATYYDTPAAWYRYNNGYIYQVDPRTMLVTAMVASVLT